jgi:hypothetical protein
MAQLLLTSLGHLSQMPFDLELNTILRWQHPFPAENDGGKIWRTPLKNLLITMKHKKE